MFRPHFDPAQLLYDALVAEQEYRSLCDSDEWIENERNAVHQAARWASMLSDVCDRYIPKGQVIGLQ